MAIYKKGYRHFLVGMALGCDMYFCEAALALRDQLPGITVEATLPCEQQTERWRDVDKERHRNLLNRCDLETMVQRNYTPDCMLRRDAYMVDRTSAVIAAYDGTPKGGTYYTLTYALRLKRETLVIDVGDDL